VTMPNALEAMAALSAARGDQLLIGAGSVLDGETARLAILAGARFLVAPIFRPAVVELCHRYDVAAIPGGYTPSEILAAWEAGADLVKVFPARTLGPGYLQELKGPLPQLRLVPTGGVTVENAGAFIAAGDFARVTAYARQLTAAIRAARERAT
jgi:2-dehydro-3-deoxyphosphogluconate aldolase/(4S)-4-hydroxy-2-oxoglutarate aldolase